METQSYTYRVDILNSFIFIIRHSTTLNLTTYKKINFKVKNIVSHELNDKIWNRKLKYTCKYINTHCNYLSAHESKTKKLKKIKKSMTQIKPWYMEMRFPSCAACATVDLSNRFIFHQKLTYDFFKKIKNCGSWNVS